MLNKQELSDLILKLVPEATFPEGTQLMEVIVPADKILMLATELKNKKETAFDYLISLTAVDFLTHMTVVYHLDSTQYRQLLVLKVQLTDRETPSVDTVSSVWTGAEFHEREVFDLFGIRFNNHPNLKRLFLEDDYGYPLRKDFRDEINIIER
ncbi:MAG TPA: NADH-quinone oxidoreductase subunit C [Prolixibacteraceae bacterium]|nr:NADH-quinone oxidoreductase subunit C [Prolixibacteraceae bacterium]